MKARLILVLSMLVLSLSISVFSLVFVKQTTQRLNEDRVRTLQNVENGDLEDADILLTDMLTFISARSSLLEILTPHDDLHELVTQLTDARISLSIGDMDDFQKAIALFRESIDHIRTHEAITISNIL